jgi:hypothetical protein
MKTAEQWRNELPLFENIKWTPQTVDKVIEQIQSNAYNQAIQDAVGKCSDYMRGEDCQKAILTLTKPNK